MYINGMGLLYNNSSFRPPFDRLRERALRICPQWHGIIAYQLFFSPALRQAQGAGLQDVALPNHRWFGKLTNRWFVWLRKPACRSPVAELVEA